MLHLFVYVVVERDDVLVGCGTHVFVKVCKAFANKGGPGSCVNIGARHAHFEQHQSALHIIDGDAANFCC